VNLDCYALGALPIKKLKGTEPDESLDLAQKGLRVASAIVIASLISDNGGLTSLDLSNNALCGVVQSFGEGGTYTAEGIKAIADALRVNGALTRVDVRFNKIAGDGAAQLSAAVLGNLKFDMFNKIPIKKMRADSFTELDLKAKYIGVEGAMVVAGLIPVMGALTVANLLGNDLDAESAKMLVQVAKQKGISLCGIQRDQTTADFSSQGLLPPDAILLASDLSQAVITGALTNMSLACNMLDEEGTKAICKALKHNKTLKELDLSGFVRSNIGGAAGAKHVADMLGVNSGLTVTNLLGNQLDAESAKLLAEVAKQKGISLCGIQRDQTIAEFSRQYLHKRLLPPDAILLASDLSQAVVTGALTECDLRANKMGEEGKSSIRNAVQGKAGFELHL
jgi:hypothetical protein